MWRPSPLFRAHRLERALGTPARIYYKYEGTSPVGSHKPNTAVAQAYADFGHLDVAAQVGAIVADAAARIASLHALTADGAEPWPRLAKAEVARRLALRIADALQDAGVR